jgi:phytoene dehydrogenase-like protein
VRVSTYVAEHDRLDAAAAVAQLRRAQHNVLYLDGGWQTLVDGLHGAATAAGVTIVHGKANAVASDGTAAQVTYDGGELDSASIVLAAGGPSHAAGLLGGASPTVERWASEADPVVATCLDLALRRGRDRTGPVLGLDEPTYLIPHSRSAHLAPEGGEVVHAMWYGPDGSPDRDHRASLEELMDLAHPGWRDQVVDVRVGRRLVVAHDRPRPGVAGADRPGVEVPELANVFVAGDWITAEGMLADAALSSAVRAGRLAAAVRHPGALVG